MLPVRSVRFTRGGIAPALLATAFLLPVANAASGGQPLILDTQRGISDGQSGMILQNAPLSHARIVQAQPIASPAEFPTDSSVPVIVAPYINLPVGTGESQRPQPSPRPLPTLPLVPPSTQW